jgi:cytochrome oxidase Cu insertion factor (SCO1/SenC/PrrC family)
LLPTAFRSTRAAALLAAPPALRAGSSAASAEPAWVGLLAALALLLGAAGCGPGGSEVALPAGAAATAEETRPLAVRAAMPDVELQDVDGRPVRLASLLEQGPIALVFYRGGW